MESFSELLESAPDVASRVAVLLPSAHLVLAAPLRPLLAHRRAAPLLPPQQRQHHDQACDEDQGQQADHESSEEVVVARDHEPVQSAEGRPGDTSGEDPCAAEDCERNRKRAQSTHSDEVGRGNLLDLPGVLEQETHADGVAHGQVEQKQGVEQRNAWPQDQHGGQQPQHLAQLQLWTELVGKGLGVHFKLCGKALHELDLLVKATVLECHPAQTQERAQQVAEQQDAEKDGVLQVPGGVEVVCEGHVEYVETDQLQHEEQPGVEGHSGDAGSQQHGQDCRVEEGREPGEVGAVDQAGLAARQAHELGGLGHDCQQHVVHQGSDEGHPSLCSQPDGDRGQVGSADREVLLLDNLEVAQAEAERGRGIRGVEEHLRVAGGHCRTLHFRRLAVDSQQP